MKLGADRRNEKYLRVESMAEDSDSFSEEQVQIARGKGRHREHEKEANEEGEEEGGEREEHKALLIQAADNSKDICGQHAPPSGSSHTSPHKDCPRWGSTAAKAIALFMFLYVAYIGLQISQAKRVFDLNSSWYLQEPPLLADRSRLSDIRIKDRAQQLNSGQLFSFVHISKCGGTNFIKWAMNDEAAMDLMPHFFPQNAMGAEYGVLYDEESRPTAQRLVMLRSPRSHILSMFKECRYNEWGSKWTKDFFNVEGTHQEDLEKWIGNWSQPLKQPHPGCYNPWNYQSRAMTSHQQNPHKIGEEGWEPSLDLALASYLRMDFVGLTDFYQESLCLLFARASSISVANLYLNSFCDCQKRVVAPTINDHPKFQRSPNVRSDDVDITPWLAIKMDRMSEVDKALYTVALRAFMREVKNAEARFERRIMCSHVLKEVEPKLAYLTNVTALYEFS